MYAVTDNARLLCEASSIDALLEATGEIEFGAQGFSKPSSIESMWSSCMPSGTRPSRALLVAAEVANAIPGVKVKIHRDAQLARGHTV